MVQGHLLLEAATFLLPPEELSLFVEHIDSLILAVDNCLSNRDTIYGTGDLANINFIGLKFHELCNPESLQIIQKQLPDFRHDIQIFLITHLLACDSNTNGTCTSLEELEQIHPLENNGLIGLKCHRFSCSQDFAVYDEESWHQWKTTYLTKYPHKINWQSSSHSYLPNLLYSNIMLGHECRNRLKGKGYEDFYKLVNHVSAGGQKNAIAIEVGGTVAKCNYYYYNERVSKLNQNDSRQRNIYSLEKQGKLVYLSIDVEKASFEVCDHNGRHLGEYLFDGTMHQAADLSGRHDISI